MHDTATNEVHSNGIISKPKYAIHIILDEKDYICTQNTSAFSNETLALCKDLFHILYEKFRKLKYYDDYCAWVGVDTSDVIQDVCVVSVFFVNCFAFLGVRLYI